MKRVSYLWFVVANMVAGVLILRAQGVVTFANVGPGINAPVSGPEGLLDVEFTAQLQLADGTNVGDPVAFVANGLFSGGTRTIDGVPGGASVDLRVAVSNEDGSFAGVSGVVTVTLGGVGFPPAPPAVLTGLNAFSIHRSGPYYDWVVLPFEVEWCELPGFHCELLPPDTVVCGLFGTDAISLLRVDNCLCADLPLPENSTLVGTQDPCGYETNGGIGFRLQDNGSLELRWPIGRGLLQSSRFGDTNREIVTPDRHENGSQVKSIPTSDRQMFYWIEKLVE